MVREQRSHNFAGALLIWAAAVTLLAFGLVLGFYYLTSASAGGLQF